jgi:hypothetical protein
LQKYGFRAVAFIIPGLIPETAPRAQTYADFAAGHASAEDLLARERSEEPLCSWEELKTMHESGVIDFQSHTLYHHQVCVAEELVDFLHPRYPAYFFGNINVPAYRQRGEWRFERRLAWGTPVYRAEPRMAGLPAFFDDERVRQACIDFVRNEGGRNFFSSTDWRKRLLSVYHAQSKRFKKTGMEARADQHQAILEDLAFSKKMIEQSLPGQRVEQLCYPWFMGCPLVVRLSKETGYTVNYWGIVPNRPTNRRGQSLFYVPRVEDYYLFRLPGEGRLRLREILKTKFKSNLPGFTAKMMKN